MRKIKGGYFTDEPTPTTQVGLNPLSSISSTDATELTTSCSINDIMKAFDNNPDSIDINNFSYTPNVTNAPQLEGREALVEMLKEVINDTDIYNTDNETSSIITQPPMQTGAGKYKRIIKKVIKKIKKNIKTKTLVMTGSDDLGSTVEMSKSLSNDLINSSFTMINNGKHLCSIECADDVNINLKNFINN